MKHELQFNDGGDDWCVFCGTFSCYIKPDEECCKAPEAKFDFRQPENFARQAQAMFGQPEAVQAA